MAPPASEEKHGFNPSEGCERKRSLSTCGDASERWAGIAMAPLYVGAAARELPDGSAEVGISVHDGTYSVDFAVHHIAPAGGETLCEAMKTHAKTTLAAYCAERHAKFIGAGLSRSLAALCPDLPAFLWRELDIVAMVFKVEDRMPRFEFGNRDGDGGAADDGELAPVPVDEKADSAVRKAIMHFGPSNNPVLSIGFRNKVEVDTSGRIELVHSPQEYEATVSKETWQCVMKYVEELKKEHVRIAFFSATPQGGGVALMRHALIRFFKLMGVDCHWYIPKPNPKVFRITKTNHNILQGVADPDARLDADKQQQMTDWITYNAQRYWLGEGGPLAAGGADIAIVDDPQMPGLIPLIKAARPEVKVIYRSHIEIRSDLVAQAGSPQAEVWAYLWERIRHADLFISHPVDAFVPAAVPAPMVGLMPATTDWLDGLNKPMAEWDVRFYHSVFRAACRDMRMAPLCYPERRYVAQIARFDPSKGIPDVLESYRKLRAAWPAHAPAPPPQLLIAGHGAVDDPDASLIYERTMRQLDRAEYAAVRADVCVMRVGPSDQILNALLSTAHVALQLSSREGFEVKVSEALHKGVPVIAARAGGIPLQVQHGRNGFLVDVGDSDAVAELLLRLFTDDALHRRLSDHAKVSVSDEVSTVGNAAAWMFLAAALARGESVKPNARWVADMYRDDCGVPYAEHETRLPRGGINVLGDK